MRLRRLTAHSDSAPRPKATFWPKWDMQKPAVKSALRHSVEAEQLKMHRIRWRYAVLCAKVSAYQEGAGPAPTEHEFEQWREDGKALAKLRELQLEAVKKLDRP